MFKGFLIIQECIMEWDEDKFLKIVIFLSSCEGLSGDNTILSEIKLIQVGNPTNNLADIYLAGHFSGKCDSIVTAHLDWSLSNQLPHIAHYELWIKFRLNSTTFRFKPNSKIDTPDYHRMGQTFSDSKYL